VTAWECLRPTSVAALGTGDPFEAAAFPLVPYSNRIRNGRFTFRGVDVQLPLNRPPERHSIHGHGWQAGWTVTERDVSAARLEYRHASDAWPWTYRASQRFVLAPSRLTVELSLENQSDRAMPAGFGWHPYFPRTPETTITAGVDAMWSTDDGHMPAELTSPPADLARGMVADTVALDNGFVGWRHRAVIDWREHGVRVMMTADAPLDCLVLYTPPGRPFMCVEPVSHVTDAFNLGATGRKDTGMRVLEPGETLRGTITLTMEMDA
jgi:aldose 1-epimerase